VLKQNYPNPFNPATRIEYSLPVSSEVKLVVYNLLGQEVATLINEEQSAGSHSIQWNASDANGTRLSSGIYFYELKAAGTNGNNFQQVKKMILLK
ncbi:MAG TPA: FlgD immunoglobulin-like domain containing protein, partial [Ignavibacteriaceae bacterium]|nr:FlgD immunoglobulin-like domain containing protein [Ignavibacteriaceae bacterium]